MIGFRGELSNRNFLIHKFNRFNMKILNMMFGNAPERSVPYAGLLLGLALLLWPLVQRILQFNYPDSGTLDPNIWLLIILSIATFLIIIIMAWWLMQRYWLAFGLPEMESMVLQFNRLELAAVKVLYAFFALLLLVAVGCLMAVL
jgi:hypothetical protein